MRFIREIALEVDADEVQVVVLKIVECAKMEHYQNRHNLAVGHAGSTTAVSLPVGNYKLFRQLFLPQIGVIMTKEEFGVLKLNLPQVASLSRITAGCLRKRLDRPIFLLDTLYSIEMLDVMGDNNKVSHHRAHVCSNERFRAEIG